MITALAWSPTQPVLAVAGDSGLVQLWRVDGTPRLERSLTGLPQCPGRPKRSKRSPSPPTASSSPRATAADLSQKECWVPTWGTTRNIFAALAIWRASTGKLVVPKDLGTGPGRSGALAFSRDGKLLAVSRPDGSVVVLDPVTGQARRTLHPFGADETVSLAFRAQRHPRDRHPGRDRPAVEPGQRRANRGSRACGGRPGHQHRRPTLRASGSRPPAVRTERSSCGPAQRSSRKAPRSPPNRAPLPPPRSSPAARTSWSSTTTATASPGRPHSPPGSSAPVRSPAAT